MRNKILAAALALTALPACAQAAELREKGVISGGMIPKIDCCVEAVRRGVTRTNIIDGRIPHSILIELFTDAGIGTMFSA